jgi:hypothetical protein
MNEDVLVAQIAEFAADNSRLRAMVADLAIQHDQAKADMKRLWHFACCPFDHCERCIADAGWIKSLHKRLGAP